MKTSAAVPSLDASRLSRAIPRRVSPLLALRVILGGVESTFGFAAGSFAVYLICWGDLSRREPEGFAILMSALLCGFVYKLVAGAFAVRLLRGGLPAFGRLVERSVEAKGRHHARHRLTFRFHDEHGEYHSTSVRVADPTHLVDETVEALLYDPMRPAHAVLLDALPGRPRIDDDGGFSERRPMEVIATIALFALGLVVHAAAAIWLYALGAIGWG